MNRRLGALAALVTLVSLAVFGTSGYRTAAQTGPGVQTTINAAGTPQAVAVNPTTNAIYVADKEGSILNISGALNQVSFVVPPNQQPASTILAVNPTTNRLYATTNPVLFEFDGSSNKQVASSGTGVLSGMAVNPTTNTVYITFNSGATVALNNGTDLGFIKVITVPSGTLGVLAVNPVTNRLYVANTSTNKVFVVDAGSGSAIATINGGNGISGIAVNPNTNTIAETNFNDNTVEFINGSTNQVTATLNVGLDPDAVAVNTFTNTYYVANHFDGTVTVIQGGSSGFSVTATVPVGTQPVSIDVNPNTGLVYVANNGSGNVSVIATPGIATPSGTVTATPTQTGTQTPTATPAPGTHVSYPAGWNLVGGPAGTVLTGAAGSLFTFQAGDTAYESFAATAPLQADKGYWAYFPTGGTVTLAQVTAQTMTVTLPANQYIQAGNPTDGNVSVSGADFVQTYNAATQSYTSATGTATLQPGQGAWVFSKAGGKLTITPQ